MPEVSRFYGIVVTMQYLDCGQHSKPHIHVKYGGCKASIGLDGKVLAGSLPKQQLSQLRDWMGIHPIELAENWEKAVKGYKIKRIEPLKEA